MATINFTSRIASTTADGVLVEAQSIKDEALNKLQSEINSVVNSQIIGLNSEITNLKKSLGDVGQTLTGIYTPCGSVDNYADLPTEGNSLGDVYDVKTKSTVGDKTYAAGTNFVWIKTKSEVLYTEEDQEVKDGTKTVEDIKEAAQYGWDALGGEVDFSEVKQYADDQIEAAIDDLVSEEGAVGKLQAKANELEGSVGTLTENLDDVTGRLETVESSTEALTGRLDTAEETIDGIQSDITDLGGSVETLETNVSTLQTNMTTLLGDENTEGSIKNLAAAATSDALEWLEPAAPAEEESPEEGE